MLIIVQYSTFRESQASCFPCLSSYLLAVVFYLPYRHQSFYANSPEIKKFLQFMSWIFLKTIHLCNLNSWDIANVIPMLYLFLVFLQFFSCVF